MSSLRKLRLVKPNFPSKIGKAPQTGQVWGTELGKSLRSKLTSARQAENWLKYLSSFGYAIAFDDGKHINIHLCCLSTLQTDPRKGCSDDQFSWLTRSPWDPVQLGTKKMPSDVIELFLWGMGMGAGWGGGGNTNQERPLDWKALKDDCFLTGSLLPEQREKFGHNFISSRSAVAEAVRLTWLLGWNGELGDASRTEHLGVPATGGGKFPSPSPSSPAFVEVYICCQCSGLPAGCSGMPHLVLISRQEKRRECACSQVDPAQGGLLGFSRPVF